MTEESSETPINIGDETHQRPKTYPEKIKALIEPADEKTSAFVTNPELVEIAELLIMPHNQALEDVLSLKKRANEVYSKVKKQNLPDTDFQKFYQELMLLGKEMADRIQELSPAPVQETSRETASVPKAPLNGGERGTTGVEKLLYIGPTKEQFLNKVFSMEAIHIVENTGVISTRPWYMEASGAERDLYDAIAELSTAGAQKRQRGEKLEHLVPDLADLANINLRPVITELTKEQCNHLIGVAGVKALLREYASAITTRKKFKITTVAFGASEEKETTIEECKDEQMLEQIRKQMRDSLLSFKPDQLTQLTAEQQKQKEQAALAEAIAYLFIYNGNLVESVAADKVPAPTLISKVGFVAFRQFCDPLTRALSKLNAEKPDKSHEGWGAYKTWITERIEATDLRIVAEALKRVYPKKLGVSFFEYVKLKNPTAGDEEGETSKTSLLDTILSGADFELASETPFQGYYIDLAKRKAIFDILGSEKERIDAKTPVYEAGRQIGLKINQCLQALEMTGDDDLTAMLIVAMYHDDKAKKIRYPTSIDPLDEAAFIEGLTKVGIKKEVATKFGRYSSMLGFLRKFF